MPAHARYGGSTIKRTKNCPPWAKYCAKNGLKSKGGPWADEGTLCHNAMQRIYQEDVDFDPKNVIGMTYEGQTLTEDLFDEMVEPAMEAVEDLIEKYDVNDFTCESHVIIDEEKDIYGFADWIGRGTISAPNVNSEGKVLGEPEILQVGICLDYKFGRGTMVDAEDNDQGLFYSVGGSLTPETHEFFENIDLLLVVIVQPNDRGRPTFTTWPLDAEVLEQEHEIILDACEAAEDADIQDPAAFKTGDHCDFCPADGFCPPTSGELARMLRLDVTAPDLVEKIPTFNELQRVKKTVKALLELAEEQLGLGVVIPGFKLVPKTSQRFYADVLAVEAAVKKSRKLTHEETHTSTLLPLTRLETLFKKKNKGVPKAKRISFEKMIAPHIQKASSGTTLASDDDKRDQAVSIGALGALLNKKD